MSEERNKPILPGTAATDYERYLRTDELLSLQKTSDGGRAPRRAPVPGRPPVVGAVAEAGLHSSSSRRRRSLAGDGVAPGDPAPPPRQRLHGAHHRAAPHARAHVAGRLRRRPHRARARRGVRLARLPPGASRSLPRSARRSTRCCSVAASTLLDVYQRRLRARRPLPARRTDDDLGRARHPLAVPPSQGRGADHRRERDRDAGHAGGSAGQAHRRALLPGVVDRPRRDYAALTARRGRSLPISSRFRQSTSSSSRKACPGRRPTSSRTTGMPSTWRGARALAPGVISRTRIFTTGLLPTPTAWPIAPGTFSSARSFRFCAAIAAASPLAAAWVRSRPRSRLRRRAGASDHGDAEVVQHVVDRIGDRDAAAARVEQTDRARVRRDVLDHQGARVAAREEPAAPVADDHLAGVGLAVTCRPRTRRCSRP